MYNPRFYSLLEEAASLREALGVAQMSLEMAEKAHSTP